MELINGSLMKLLQKVDKIVKFDFVALSTSSSMGKCYFLCWMTSVQNRPFIGWTEMATLLNSFNTNPVFSRQIVNVVCLCDFIQFCNFWQTFEWRLKERRPCWSIRSRAKAFLGAIWALRGKLLTQSSFGVEWVNAEWYILHFGWTKNVIRLLSL